ncbi:MAG: M28 family peptidase [Actinobacteria bacterium]|nr:MAG: M28 family peptidase [Actinomycetota bacterium]
MRTELAQATLAPPYDNARAMAHVAALAALGPRTAGGAAEHEGFDYVADRLREYGYAVTVQNVTLPSGRTSHNVIAERAGASADVVVLGAHADSKWPSPGANDNASGVGVVLELARVFAQAQQAPTVRFIAFGAEEIAGVTADDHHFGSRQYVASLSSAQRSRIAAAVSVDMVGYGTVFNVRSMQVGPPTAVVSLQRWGTATGQPLPFLKDLGRYGWSDHEGFERVGIPAAWLEWRVDPAYHTTGDTHAHVQPARVRACGHLLRGWLLDLDAADLDALH